MHTQNRRRGSPSSAGVVLAASLLALSAHAQTDGAREGGLIVAYGSGTEWVVDARGAMLSKNRVLVQLEVDERAGVVREAITPARAGYGATDTRELLADLRSFRVGDIDTTWVARVEQDGVVRTVTTVLSRERIWSYEVWTDRAGKVVLYRVRDAVPISQQRHEDAARRRERALDRMSR